MATRSIKRSAKISPHVRFYHWELKSAAFRSPSLAARCVLIELKALYNGSNNGSLFLSAREAAKRVGIGKTLAWEALHELQEKGFIRAVQRGSFSWKTGARRGDATCWLLTEHPPGAEMGVGTKEFMAWKGGAVTESVSRFAETDALSARANQASVGTDNPAE